jgi:hypothetical protein
MCSRQTASTWSADSTIRSAGDHINNDAKTVKPVSGTAEIDVNDLTNTGKFEAD